MCVQAGDEAGPDAGADFVTAFVSGINLAVRADALRAYVAEFSGTANPDKIKEILQHCGLTSILDGAVERVQELQDGRVNPWILIAEGQAPVTDQGESIEFLYPSETLGLTSVSLGPHFTASTPDFAGCQNLQAIAVGAGQVLVRLHKGQGAKPGRDVFGREIQQEQAGANGIPLPGTHVTVSKEGEYRAQRYGYLCLLDNRLSVVSPLWISADNVRVDWLILNEDPHPVTSEMIHQILDDLDVRVGIKVAEIASLVEEARMGRHSPGVYVVAEGVRPVDGKDAQVDILVDTERRAGAWREDGSIDFHDVNFSANVRSEQLVARRQPPSSGNPGTAVTGESLRAKDGCDVALKAGDDIRVETEGDTDVYYATTSGALQVSEGEISVIQLLIIKSDVSYMTGNLDFGGEVLIYGSVLQGFSVKATGDVTIAGTVEDGALVHSGGDVVVGKGIVGRRARVIAGGSLRAQFLQNSTVVAGADIELGSFAYHAHITAGNHLSMAKGGGHRGGSVIGGEAWARSTMDLFLAGSTAQVPTLLVAGLTPDSGKKLGWFCRSQGEDGCRPRRRRDPSAR